jgi:ElaA protein
MNWSFKKFDELSPMELYSIMQLRNEVFVVEQNCVYQDADNKDIQSYHPWDGIIINS